MGDGENPDRQLVLQMVKATGLTATQIALKAGLAPSTLTRIQNNRTTHRLSVPTLEKIKSHFPAAFEHQNQGQATTPKTDGPRYSIQQRSSPLDVPLYGGPIGTPVAKIPFINTEKRFVKKNTSRAKLSDNEVEVDLISLDLFNPIGAVRRPPSLDFRTDVFAIRWIGNSMSPRFRNGDILYVDPRRSPGPLDDVLIEHDGPDDPKRPDLRWFILKSVTSIGLGMLWLEQFEPPSRFSINAETARLVGCVIPPAELLSQ